MSEPADADRQPPDRADWPVRIYRMGEEPSDLDDGLSRPVEERLAAVEALGGATGDPDDAG